MATELKITLVRSHIGRTETQKSTLKGLGLNKVQKQVVLKDSPETRGMIKKVAHLVKVEE